VPRTDIEETRSGTWATVRYAREIGLPIYVVKQNGQVVRDAG
jgi:predicted Rossmann fold nucleotide-binding protein DprA/Smf involved in DNA uptake